MTTTEILRTFLWNIKLYSYSPDEQSIHDDLVAKARKYIGLDIFMLRGDLQYEDVLVLILNDISGQLNRCDWQFVDKNFRLFDEIAKNKLVLSSLLFERWYLAAEFYYRRGLLDKAISCTVEAEKYAVGHEKKFRMLLQRGRIESSNKNRYEFSVNSLSAALYEAEQLGEAYVAQAYNGLAHMFGLRYAALGIYFLRKEQVVSERLSGANLLVGNKLSRVNCYAILAMRYPQDETIFLDEAKKVLAKVDYDSLPIIQNKMYYKELQGKIYHDVKPLIEACAYYQKVDSIDEVCRLCDAILEIGINYYQEIQALPYVELYRQMEIMRNREDKKIILEHIKEAEEIIYGKLGN